MQPGLERTHSLFRSRTEIYDDAYQGRQFDAIYFAMLVFACLIALLGLLLNSPAVIIGAMLISPLMGPILACGLALTLADWALGKKAARNVAFSVGETILIAVLATLLSPLKDATPEILARTNPNLMDLLIAFFSGAAGTLALCSRKGGLTILPGVAIATAVMPPLATTGYGVSTGQWEIARGAFMLFFTNLTAIIISANIVFLLVGFRPERISAKQEQSTLVRWRFLIAGIVLIVLAIPLIRTLTQAAEQANLRKQAKAVLAKQMSPASERKLDRVSLELRGKEISVEAAVETATFIEPQEIQEWQKAIQSRVGKPVQLELQQLQLARKQTGENSKIGSNKDFLAGGVIKSVPPAEQHPSIANELQDLQERMRTSLTPLMRTLGVQNFKIHSVVAEPDGGVAMEAEGSISQLIPAAGWQVAATAVSGELHSPLQLTGNLTVGEPILLRFRPGSLRLNPSDRHNLAKFFSRWNKEPNVSYQLVLANSTDPTLAETRATLLKKRSEKMTISGENNNSVGEDTVVLQAVQHLGAATARVPQKAAEASGNNVHQ